MKCIYILTLYILYNLLWYSNAVSYTGKNAADAGVYLDNSQGEKGFGFSNPGHPREHASAPNPPNIETYSATQEKTGFDSREIQNEVAHLVLIHPKVQQAMDILNQYDEQKNNSEIYKRQDVKLSKNDLNIEYNKLTGGTWLKGKKTASFPIRAAVIVIQHFPGQQNNPGAGVHIQTFYPTPVSASYRSFPLWWLVIILLISVLDLATLKISIW